MVELINSLLAKVVSFVPFLFTLTLIVAGLMFISWFLKRQWKNNPDSPFRYQLIMLSATLASGLAVIIALPVSDSLRGQLLSLIGILLSAAIALSATTFIGNVLAGIMLRAIRSVRPGDFITVAEITGRVTEMDLLHTEVQTEDRDLVTVPNMFMVTKPMKVVRATGTIVSAEVSLGYDVSQVKISELLREAATNAGLTDAFVQVRDLGDFSVLYRVGGLLQEVKSLISARSKLREAMLDSLHRANIEIVSPNFINTRALSNGKVFIAQSHTEDELASATQKEVMPEDIAFDKANEAATIEELRKTVNVVNAALLELEESENDAVSEKQRAVLEVRKARLIKQLEIRAAQLKALDENEGAHS